MNKNDLKELEAFLNQAINNVRNRMIKTNRWTYVPLSQGIHVDYQKSVTKEGLSELTHLRHLRGRLRSQMDDCELNPAKKLQEANQQLTYMQENNFKLDNRFEECITLNEQVHHRLMMMDWKRFNLMKEEI